MDKYEYRVKTEQMLECMEKKQYKKAMDLADTIDWRRVKNVSMLNNVSEIYENCDEYEKASEVLSLAYDRSPGSRKVVYRLGTVALKNNDIDLASECYEEFVKLASKDPNQYILKYKILKARKAPIEEQIAVLEDFKKAEYVEKWAYELAELYDKAGMQAECLEECDDLILWFSEGKYVYQAMELKMKYKPLTPLQLEKYNNRHAYVDPDAVEPEIEEEEVEEVVAPEGATPEGSTTEETTAEETATVGPDTQVLPEIEETEDSKDSIQDDMGKTKVFTTEADALKNAALIEAMAKGASVVKGKNMNEKNNTKTDEELRITGQMKIDEILQEWEEKQKTNAEAIAAQKKKDEEELAKRKEEAKQRREEEARRIEEQQRAAEEARKVAEQKATEEARKAAEKKAEEEKLQATQKTEEESHDAESKEQEDDELLSRLAAGEAIDVAVEEPAKKETDENFSDEDDVLEEFNYEVVKEEPEKDTFGEPEYDETEYVEEDEDDEDFEDDDFEEDDLDDYDEDDLDDEDYDDAEFEDEYDDEDLDDDEDDADDFDDEDEDDFDDEDDDFDEDDDDSDEDDADADDDSEELEIEEPTEEEIQKRIKKGKSGVPFDTGFVVTGRYDLSATSEIGLKAGLTEEQKKLFSYFVPVRGMSEQIVEVLDNDRRGQREGTSRTGNILVIGQKGSGKTVLAVDIVKAIQKQRNLKQGKVAIVTGESLNKKELSNIIQKLRGGAIIIEKAGKLNTRTVKELNHLMEKKTGELLFVLEDQRKPLERLFTASPNFKRKFTSILELPVFVNDELVTFGQTYAKENGYKLDEMGILALYSRIDVMQREDHAVTVAEVKEIMDNAIDHSQKANVKHLARRVFGKSVDSTERIILKEEDFKS